MSADFEQVMAQCSRGCFTGLLRIRTREGNGEVRFLSGIQDGIRFDSMEGDAALERLLSASDPEFEAISSLPPIDFASTEPVPPEGGLERYHAAQLMRYCESNSLTCALELEVGGRVLTARYRLGELLSVEPDSEHTARLAEAKEGLYRFKLPRFELPANVQQRRSVPAARPAASPATTPARGPTPAAAPKAAPAPAAARPAPAPPPVAARSAPPPVAPVAARPAPAAATKPAPAPFAARPAPGTVKPTPASLAETPIVAMKPVAIVTPGQAPVAPKPASPFAKAPPSPAPASSQPGVPPVPKVAAAAGRPGEARPAPSPTRAPAGAAPPLGSGAARREGPRLGPGAITPQPGRPAAQPGGAVHPAPVAAHGSGASPTSRPPAPRSPVPAMPPSAPPTSPPAQAKPAQLQGLWTDAVKPPPQSAPLELDGSVRGGASGAHRPLGRTEGLSSIAYTPPQTPPVPTARTRSSAGYWLVAVALLIAVAAVGWFTFGP